jgi:hypothetical protein
VSCRKASAKRRCAPRPTSPPCKAHQSARAGEIVVSWQSRVSDVGRARVGDPVLDGAAPTPGCPKKSGFAAWPSPTPSPSKCQRQPQSQRQPASTQPLLALQIDLGDVVSWRENNHARARGETLGRNVWHAWCLGARTRMPAQSKIRFDHRDPAARGG